MLPYFCKLETDVNFGELTRCMLAALNAKSGANLHLSHEVRGLRRDGQLILCDRGTCHGYDNLVALVDDTYTLRFPPPR